MPRGKRTAEPTLVEGAEPTFTETVVKAADPTPVNFADLPIHNAPAFRYEPLAPSGSVLPSGAVIRHS